MRESEEKEPVATVSVGGNQILVEDPAGNLVELFEPTIPEAAEKATPTGG